MKKVKRLLALMLLGTACAGVFAFAGCSTGNNSGDKNGDDDNIDIVDPDVPSATGRACTQTQRTPKQSPPIV